MPVGKVDKIMNHKVLPASSLSLALQLPEGLDVSRSSQPWLLSGVLLRGQMQSLS